MVLTDILARAKTAPKKRETRACLLAVGNDSEEPLGFVWGEKKDRIFYRRHDQ
jgi:hypothetical protein